MCDISIHIWPRDHSSDRNTAGEGQVCEYNWVRRIGGVRRIDKQRVEEPREEVWSERKVYIETGHEVDKVSETYRTIEGRTPSKESERKGKGKQNRT